MKRRVGNIWDCLTEGYLVVIPVNIGWKRDGTNVMGRGLAKAARDRYPACARWLGQRHKSLFERNTPFDDASWIIPFPGESLIFFPTKPLNKEQPWASWKSDSDPELISNLLAKFPQEAAARAWDKIAVPLLGAGLGNLARDAMEKIIEYHLGHDERFLLVTLD